MAQPPQAAGAGAPRQPPQQRVPNDNDPRYNYASPYLLSDPQIRYLRSVMGGKRIHVKDDATMHPHPCLHYERAHAEHHILRQIGDVNVVDIGGAALRHARKHRNHVWSLNPVMSAADVIRQASNDLAGEELNSCRHSLLQHFELHNDEAELECNYPFVDHPYVAISIHSIYYIPRIEILELVHRTPVFLAAHHNFDNPVGSIALGELTWEDDGNGFVECVVKGNSSRYRHSNLAWMRDHYYEHQGRAMTWTTTAIIGNTYITTFARCQLGIVVEPHAAILTFTDALNDADYYGEIDNRKLVNAQFKVNPVFTTLHTSFDRIRSAGRYISFGRSDRKTVFVPKDAVAATANRLAGFQRDEHTYVLAHKTAVRVLQEFNLRPSDVHAMASYVAASAFACDLETQAFDIVADNRDELVSYNDSLKLKMPFWTPFRLRVALATTAVVAMFLWYHRRSTWWHTIQSAILIPFRLTVNPLLPGPASARALALPNFFYVIAALLTARYHSILVSFRTTHLDAPAVHAHGYISTPDVCTRYDGPLAPMRAASTLERLPTPEGCRPGLSHVQVGPALACLAPRTLRSCSHNEERGLRSRVLGLRQDGEDQRLAYLGLAARVHAAYPSLFTPVRQHVEAAPYHVWASRFPTAKRLQLDAAREQLAAGHIDWRRNNVNKNFVKKEHILIETPAGLTASRPRIINACSVANQLIHGPWTFAYSKYLAECWSPQVRAQDGPVQQITYAAGMNANAIGRWFDDNLALGLTAAACNDCGYWDLTQHQHAFDFHMGLYERVCIPSRVRSCIRRHAKFTGVSGHWLAKTDCLMGTGVGYTSVQNSQGNGCISWDIIRALAPNSPFRILVMGDDMMVMAELSTIKRLLAAEPLYRAYGLNPELNCFADAYDGDFCSMIFFPTNRGTLPGPKPGRFLAKIGYCRDPVPVRDLRAWMHAVTIGETRNCHHVPIVRTIIAVARRLSAGGRTLNQSALYDLRRHRRHERPQVDYVAPPHELDHTTIEFFSNRYGVSPSAIHACESWIERTYVSLTSTLAHPILTRLTEIDAPQKGLASALASRLGAAALAPATMLFNAVVLVPVQEECIHAVASTLGRRFALALRMAHGLLEVYQQRKPLNLPLQLAFHMMPIPYRFAAHISWNAFYFHILEPWAIANGHTRESVLQRIGGPGLLRFFSRDLVESLEIGLSLLAVAYYVSQFVSRYYAPDRLTLVTTPAAIPPRRPAYPDTTE